MAEEKLFMELHLCKDLHCVTRQAVLAKLSAVSTTLPQSFPRSAVPLGQEIHISRLLSARVTALLRGQIQVEETGLWHRRLPALLRSPSPKRR